MTAIKFCGMTRAEDVALAIELGVDAVGFVLWSGSPRYVDAGRASTLIEGLPRHITPVGVYVRPSDADIARGIDAGIRVAQIHGAPDVAFDRVPCEVWLAASVENHIPNGCTVLLDAHDPQRHGGTGRTIDWNQAAKIAFRQRVMLAGGLTAANVGDAIRAVRPYGVDVASGIEDAPGVKNAEAMKAFVSAVREADR
jgi:phosphoribosylanthranilate isomerase